MTAPTRPVMRYHGGKFRISQWVIQHFMPHTTYVEPFAGAASVLMRKHRASVEVINDLDDAVVNVFEVLRDPIAARELCRLVELTPWSRTEFYKAYDPTDDVIEAARRTLIRSFMGFGSSALVRTRTGFRGTSTRNKVRDYADDWRNYPANIPLFVDRLRGVTIENREASKVMGTYDRPTTLFYVDPPYPHVTRSKVEGDGHNGYRFELTDDQHRTLGAEVRRLTGGVVISGYACDLYDHELFPDWMRVSRPARAQGQGLGVSRTEVLWLNPRAAAALAPTLFDNAAPFPPHPNGGT